MERYEEDNEEDNDAYYHATSSSSSSAVGDGDEGPGRCLGECGALCCGSGACGACCEYLCLDIGVMLACCRCLCPAQRTGRHGRKTGGGGGLDESLLGREWSDRSTKSDLSDRSDRSSDTDRSQGDLDGTLVFPVRREISKDGLTTGYSITTGTGQRNRASNASLYSSQGSARDGNERAHYDYYDSRLDTRNTGKDGKDNQHTRMSSDPIDFSTRTAGAAGAVGTAAPNGIVKGGLIQSAEDAERGLVLDSGFMFSAPSGRMHHARSVSARVLTTNAASAHSLETRQPRGQLAGDGGGVNGVNGRRRPRPGWDSESASSQSWRGPSSERTEGRHRRMRSLGSSVDNTVPGGSALWGGGGGGEEKQSGRGNVSGSATWHGGAGGGGQGTGSLLARMESEARSGGGRGDRGVSSGVRRRRRPPKDILIDFSLIKLGRMLGQGATAVVRHGFYSYAYRKKREVAIKVCMCDEVTEKSTADFIREANIIASLDHPNVLKVVGVCMVPPACWIVTEFCSQGSLFDYLQSRAEAAAAAAAATAANDAVLTVSTLPTVYGGVGGSGGGEGEAGGARMGDIFGSGAARGFSACAKAKEKPQSAKEKERGGRGKSTSTHGRKAKTGSKGFSRRRPRPRKRTGGRRKR